jgi:hypothetical protein
MSVNTNRLALAYENIDEQNRHIKLGSTFIVDAEYKKELEDNIKRIGGEIAGISNGNKPPRNFWHNICHVVTCTPFSEDITTKRQRIRLARSMVSERSALFIVTQRVAQLEKRSKEVRSRNRYGTIGDALGKVTVGIYVGRRFSVSVQFESGDSAFSRRSRRVNK